MTTVKEQVARVHAQVGDAQVVQHMPRTIAITTWRSEQRPRETAHRAAGVIDAVQAITTIDLRGEAADLASTHTFERYVIAEAKQYPPGEAGEVCPDAASVAGQAVSVAAYATGIGLGASTTEHELATIREDIGELNSDDPRLRSDEAKLPGYDLDRQPSPAAVPQATSRTTTGIAAAVTTTNADIDQANIDATNAFQYGGASARVGLCQIRAAPTPIAHIS